MFERRRRRCDCVRLSAPGGKLPWHLYLELSWFDVRDRERKTSGREEVMRGVVRTIEADCGEIDTAPLERRLLAAPEDETGLALELVSEKQSQTVDT